MSNVESRISTISHSITLLLQFLSTIATLCPFMDPIPTIRASTIRGWPSIPPSWETGCPVLLPLPHFHRTAWCPLVPWWIRHLSHILSRDSADHSMMSSTSHSATFLHFSASNSHSCGMQRTMSIYVSMTVTVTITHLSIPSCRTILGRGSRFRFFYTASVIFLSNFYNNYGGSPCISSIVWAFISIYLANGDIYSIVFIL